MDSCTRKFVSIAERPGSFGVNFHNQGYVYLGLNCVYIPLKIESGQLESFIDIIRDNFDGCSVSMPHKTHVMKYLKETESSARVGAVNTILNLERRLKGYNTDYLGAKRAIEKALDIRDKRVVMAGAGGVARAIGYAVRDLSGKLAVTNRTQVKAETLSSELGCVSFGYDELDNFSGTLFINATSVGMENSGEQVIPIENISRFDAVMDVVVGKTQLMMDSEAKGRIIIPGRVMTVYQAAEQFRIYTRQELPREFLEKFLTEP